MQLEFGMGDHAENYSFVALSQSVIVVVAPPIIAMA